MLLGMKILHSRTLQKSSRCIQDGSLSRIVGERASNEGGTGGGRERVLRRTRYAFPLRPPRAQPTQTTTRAAIIDGCPESRYAHHVSIRAGTTMIRRRLTYRDEQYTMSRIAAAASSECHTTYCCDHSDENFRVPYESSDTHSC